ncbi:MAG: ABC transporter ATP-binding protein [Planctomycetia bacterium]|nr:ABC transporter ATP-binding protein [Planctomycetia bacterium]
MSAPVSHAPAPILKVAHLSYRYPVGQIALCDVNFVVGVNEIVGLVGPNGAGKTTLLLHLNGLLLGTRLAPRNGETASVGTAGYVGAAQNAAGADSNNESRAPVEVLGMPVIPENFPEIRRNVGVMFQDPDDQLFCPTVRDDVAFGPLNLDFPRDEVLRRVAESLASVGLAGFEDRRPHELSFGEKRRVCLAGVLACEPSLLALDEPSSNLDPRSRRGLIEILKKCPAAQIIASHDLELVVELCSRVIVLDQGRIQADGPTREILGNEALMARHGLEVPLSIRYGLEFGKGPR